MPNYLENSIILFFAGKGLKGKSGFLSYLFLNIANRLRLIDLKGKEFRIVFKDVTIWADASSAELGAYVEIYANNIYEKAEGFVPKPGDTVFDIGSNIGLYAVKSSKRVGPKGEVWAFEPNPTVFVRLLKNLEENEIANVITVQRAVSSREGKMGFSVSGGLTPEGKILHEEGELSINAQKAIEVDCVTLDNFIAEKGIEKVDLAKIDVEGEEYEALKGAAAKMLPATERIVLEYHNEKVKENSILFLMDHDFDLVLEDNKNRVLYFKNKRFQNG